MNILIVEDELLIAEMLKEMLLELGHNIVSIAKNYNEAITNLNDTIDLAFLDININSQKDGIDLGQKIKEQYFFPFVYLTSYSDSETLKKALSTQPDSYLVKPFNKTTIYTTVELLLSKKQNVSPSIIIKDGHLNVKIYSKNIVAIKSDNNYIEIITVDKKHVIRYAIDSFLTELNDPKIVSIHRSHAVNLNKVEAINGIYILINNEKYPLSRKYRDGVLNQFSNL